MSDEMIDATPYSDEWKTYISRHNKTFIVDLAASIGKGRLDVESQNAALQARIAELEKLLHEAEGFIGYLADAFDADKKEIKLHKNIKAALVNK